MFATVCVKMFSVFLYPSDEQMISLDCFTLSYSVKCVCIFAPGVVKAFYLRGKAHGEVWNEAEARQDFSRVLDLDPGMKKAIKKELAVLSMRMEEKNQEDRDKYKGMF